MSENLVASPQEQTGTATAVPCCTGQKRTASLRHKIDRLAQQHFGGATSLGHMTALAPTAPNLVDPCRSRAFPRIQYFRAFKTCHLHSSGGLLVKPVTRRRSVSNLEAGDQRGRTAQAAQTMQCCFKRMFKFRCSNFTGSHVGVCKPTTSSHQR